jgi:hypothetical protein
MLYNAAGLSEGILRPGSVTAQTPARSDAGIGTLNRELQSEGRVLRGPDSPLAQNARMSIAAVFHLPPANSRVGGASSWVAGTPKDWARIGAMNLVLLLVVRPRPRSMVSRRTDENDDEDDRQVHG